MAEPAVEAAQAGSGALPEADIACPICEARFTRIEHRNRHLLSHNGSKPHSCPNCKKRFTRRDTLVRHISIHGQKSCVSKHGVATRVNKACTHCARLRVKCDGEFPCSRCVMRSLQCDFSSRPNQRIAPIKDLADIPMSHQYATGLAKQSPEMAAAAAAGAGPMPRRKQQTAGASEPSMSSSERAVLDALYSLSNGQTVVAAAAEPRGAGLAGMPQGLDPTMPLLPGTGEPPPPPFTPGFSSADTLWDAGEPSSAALDLVTSPWDQDFSVLDWMTFDFGGFGDIVPTPEEMAGYFRVPVPANPFNTLGPPPLPYPTGSMSVATRDQGRYDDPTLASNAATPMQAMMTAQASRGGTRQGTPDPMDMGADSENRGPLGPPHEWPHDWNPAKADNIITFPDMSQLTPDMLDVENFGHVEPLDARTYEEFHALLRRTSKGQIQGHSFPPFETPDLPSRDMFNCCVQLYFEYFHPIFPLLHKPTFRPSSAPWRLVLATAAVGCRYSRVAQVAQCAIPLQELLRRAVFDAVETDNSHARALWYNQVVMIGHLGMTYSGNKRLLEIFEGYRNLSPTLCRRRRRDKRKEQWYNFAKGLSTEDRWRHWIEAESHTRMYFCSFLADAQYSLFFDGTPCYPVEELLQFRLPSEDRLWDAGNAQMWEQLYRHPELSHEAVPTLGVALNTVCSGKATVPQVGTFAQLILVLAIYQSATSIKRVTTQALFPDQDRQQAAYVEAIRRASAGLEVLSANIAATREQPLRRSVECHIFFTLVALLSPRDSLLNQAHCFRTDEETPALQQDTARWLAQERGEPARRAVLYAGRLLGSLREWSSHGYHEPLMILLCTVLLWTYSRMGDEGPASSSSRGGPEDADAEPGRIIRLDGPATEADADWISGRARRRGHLRDVGCITRPGAGGVIMDLGIRALSDLRTWAPTQGFAVWLSKLKGRSDAKSD